MSCVLATGVQHGCYEYSPAAVPSSTAWHVLSTEYYVALRSTQCMPSAVSAGGGWVSYQRMQQSNRAPQHGVRYVVVTSVCLGAAISSVVHMQLICCSASWVHRLLLPEEGQHTVCVSGRYYVDSCTPQHGNQYYRACAYTWWLW